MSEVGSVKIGMDGLSVMIGMPTRPELPALTARSLIGTFKQCQKMSIPCDMALVIGSAVIPWARDDVVDLFLRSDANRLFWIDSDMGWEPDQFIRLLALSQLVPVVGATYPAKVDGAVTFYVSHDSLTIGEYGLIEVNGMGLGFTVMQREVVEALAEKAPKVKDEVSGRTMASVFRVDSRNGNRRGEDVAFFHDIQDAGYKVLLDPEVSLGHVGTKVYRGSIKDAMR